MLRSCGWDPGPPLELTRLLICRHLLVIQWAGGFWLSLKGLHSAQLWAAGGFDKHDSINSQGQFVKLLVERGQDRKGAGQVSSGDRPPPALHAPADPPTRQVSPQGHRLLHEVDT